VVADRFAAAVPVAFGAASFKLKGRHYAHEGTAVVTAGTNPVDPRYSVVLVAGLSADATYRAARSPVSARCEVYLMPHGGGAKPLVVTRESETGSR
jgi:hypothetical protein